MNNFLRAFIIFLLLAGAYVIFTGKVSVKDEQGPSDEVISLKKSSPVVFSKKTEKPESTPAKEATKPAPKPTLKPAPKPTRVKKEAVPEGKKDEVFEFLKKITKVQKERAAISMNIAIKTTYIDAETTQEIKGRVVIKKKDKFRVEYTEPVEQLLISNGKTLWVYTPGLNQVIKQSVDQANLDTHFYIEIETSLNYFSKYSRNSLEEKDGNYILTMIPKNKKVIDFDKIVVGFSKDKLLPVFMNTLFESTSVEASFSGIKTYAYGAVGGVDELKNSNFVFKAPEGVEEIEASTLLQNAE